VASCVLNALAGSGARSSPDGSSMAPLGGERRTDGGSEASAGPHPLRAMPHRLDEDDHVAHATPRRTSRTGGVEGQVGGAR
jgi:hypothetical protein